MATALTATYAAGTSTDPPRVLLQVTGAPSGARAYASAFSVGNVDGWTGTAGTTLAYVTGYTAGGATVPPGLRITTAADTAGTFSRTVTGLTIGVVYRYSLYALAYSGGGKIALGVTGMASGAQVQAGTLALVAYTFTATATSHVITAKVTPPVSSGVDVGDYRLATVTVAPNAWPGTTIYRSDANAPGARVRLAAGQDVTGASGSATMTATDYEGALVAGTVQYAVWDGLGTIADAFVTVPADAGAWLTTPATADPAAPAPPGFVQVLMVTGWDETARSNGSMHVVIGRADPIANPGPLALRAGALTLLCADYAAARAVRALMAGGDVAMLRQPRFPGADVYLVATDVTVAPTAATAPTQAWTATIRYQEVLAP